MLNIIAAYQGVPAYIQAARQQSQAEWVSLWQQYAVAPYWKLWATGQFNFPDGLHLPARSR
jgi:hypothetical protein